MPNTSSPPPARSRTPDQVGRWRIVLPIAAGGLARVLLARRDDGEVAALKLAHGHLVGDPEIRAMFDMEARTLAALRHPNVVELRGLVAEGDTLAIALEHVEGVSLAFLLDDAARRGTRLASGVVLRIVGDLLAALEAVHASGVVHGDVNPRNLVVGVDGRARLVDFGLARREGVPPGDFRGTAAYGAPETIARGELGRRSDLFAAGVVAWEALRGERLFRGAGDADTLRRVIEEPAPPLDRGRPDLATLAAPVAAALAKDPSLRPSSARDLAQALVGGAGRDEVAGVVRSAASSELARRASALAATDAHR